MFRYPFGTVRQERKSGPFHPCPHSSSAESLIDSTSGTPQAQRTPGQGVWSHISGNTYRFSFKTFTFDAANTFTGWIKITHEAELDSNGAQFSSAGTAEVYAPNGALVFTGCSSTTATRFE